MPTEEKTDYVNKIWNIADLVRDAIPRADYNKLVLPFALLRRLECALEPTRNAVLQAVEEHEAEWGKESDNYCAYSKRPFYNVTSFRLSTLGSTDTYEALNTYIEGFSPNARNIMYAFQMEATCKTLQKHNLLYSVCQKFSAFDFSPEAVSDREMSNIYEHLIQRYGEEISENAEDFMTPRDVVRLATTMLFAEDEDLNSDTGVIRTLYDGCFGTGGFVADAMDLLDEWHSDRHMTAPAVIVPYGEESAEATWAMGASAMMLRTMSNEQHDVYNDIKDLSSHIMFGDTLSDDKFQGMKFDYQMTNPPYGKKWEAEYKEVVDEANLGFRGRFGAGLPSKDDGSILFLQNVYSKMKTREEGGSKAAIVLSASPLFNMNTGCNNTRRELFEADAIDCIVKLPTDIFYRTGIATYLWILNTRKPESRKGMIQLIDASEMKELLQKNQGKKRFKINKKQREWIVNTYINGDVNDHSVIVPYTEFMFRRVTTRRPLRAKIAIEEDKFEDFFKQTNIVKLSSENADILKSDLSKNIGEHSYSWTETFVKTVRKEMNKPEVTPANMIKAINDTFMVRDDTADPISDSKGNLVVDPDLNDTEDIPYTQSFDEYMNSNVLPYAPDTWIDETKKDDGPFKDGKTGIVCTNISFNKYFYHYEEPEAPKKIEDEIEELNKQFVSAMSDLFE